MKKDTPILNRISSPADLKELTSEEARRLCSELRGVILETVAANGGHLASNLGLVECTVALHRSFDSPRDSILFDVGHQAYTHKLLTGRRGCFDTLRKADGISGFVKRGENPHDKLSAGHSGTSLSAAVGMADAARLRGEDSYTIAIIGDGSFSNGMVYEALNHCSGRGLRLIIILNDNEMSISPNVGALSAYFSKIATSEGYFSFKHGAKRLFMGIPGIGKHLVGMARSIRDFIKRLLVKGNLFEDFGLDYLGPVDGNDLTKMESVLAEAKTKDTPCLVHIRTKKGLGYPPAEEHPDFYHATSPFDIEKGISRSAKENFSSVFGAALCAAAEKDSRICAITAAMTSGTGLTPFAERYPDRFFDVGIAEEHAVTLASGLAAGGMLPVFAVYSTFAQRICDQLLHDIALQKLPLVLALDRCGFVDGDGITHQGIFDIPLLSCIPQAEIWCAEAFSDIEPMLNHALSRNALTILRYPRGGQRDYDRSGLSDVGTLMHSAVEKAASHPVVITYGRLCDNALKAAEATGARVICLKRLHPLPMDELMPLLNGAASILFAEECQKRGGVGEALAAELHTRGIAIPMRILAVEESFGGQGSADDLMHAFGMDAEGLAALLRKEAIL
ncbi:MAG: 1-deoxy-D-xylulose-5-phosphate synthase [Clostridia bacterium]|nr:1-deoxy-D-xylulose-5-phosphate synthase [Clostridia bacterium]